MVGVALLSSLALASAQTKEVQYGMTPVKPIVYYKWRCVSSKPANLSDPCTMCTRSVCTRWVKEILTTEEVRQLMKERKK
jgi:hypothetical protein